MRLKGQPFRAQRDAENAESGMAAVAAIRRNERQSSAGVAAHPPPERRPRPQGLRRRQKWRPVMDSVFPLDQFVR